MSKKRETRHTKKSYRRVHQCDDSSDYSDAECEYVETVTVDSVNAMDIKTRNKVHAQMKIKDMTVKFQIDKGATYMRGYCTAKVQNSKNTDCVEDV